MKACAVVIVLSEGFFRKVKIGSGDYSMARSIIVKQEA